MHVLDKSFATPQTFVVVFPTMNSHLCTDTPGLGERLCFVIAARGLPNEVSPLVSDEVRHEIEGFATLLTSVGFLPSMDLFVSQKGYAGAKGSLAKFTRGLLCCLRPGAFLGILL